MSRGRDGGLSETRTATRVKGLSRRSRRGSSSTERPPWSPGAGLSRPRQRQLHSPRVRLKAGVLRARRLEAGPRPSESLRAWPGRGPTQLARTMLPHRAGVHLQAPTCRTLGGGRGREQDASLTRGEFERALPTRIRGSGSPRAERGERSREVGFGHVVSGQCPRPCVFRPATGRPVSS